MLKKFFITIISFLIVSSKAHALKVINPMIWDTPRSAEVVSVKDALEINAIVDRIHAPVYISNLHCHEYTRSYILKSSTGYSYVRPRQRTVRKSRIPTEFLAQLFKENEGNITFIPHGYGLYSNMVGEFYIGDKSVSAILIKKGFCDPVQ